MQWIELGPGVSQGNELFWALPLETGGDLWVRLPPSSQNQSIFLGVGDAESSPPDRLSGTLASLESFARIIKIEIPDCLLKPFLGIRFLDSFDSNYTPSYRLMTFNPPVNQSGLDVLGSVPPIANYSLGDSFIFSETGEILTLINEPFNGLSIWVGPEKLDRIQLVPAVVVAPDTAQADALTMDKNLKWSPYTGGESFFVSCFVSLLTGPSVQLALTANTNEENDYLTFPPAVVTNQAQKLTLTPMAGSALDYLNIAAVSAAEITLGVEIRHRKIYTPAP